MTFNLETSHVLEKQLLQHLKAQSKRLQNKPDLILTEMEEFGKKNNMPCLDSKVKAEYIIQYIKSHRPEVVVQFGTHTGYTTVLVANELRKLHAINTTAKVFTFEIDPLYEDICSQIIQLSGLEDMIVPIFGKSGNCIKTLAREHLVEKIDLLLLEHWPECYLPDLRVLETLSLITEGSVIIAANILQAIGAPDYLEYVRSSPAFKREYNMRIRNVNGSFYQGRWGLLYETKRVNGKNSQDMEDCIEVTKCVGLLDG